MRTPDLRPDRLDDTAENSPPADRPVHPNEPARRLSDYYWDDPNDIFTLDDSHEPDPDSPDGVEAADDTGRLEQVPADYTPEARAQADDLGFDPHTRPGPLADRHTPGVHDPVRPGTAPDRHDHELRTADLLATEGADVRLRMEDHTRHKTKDFDCIVRYDPNDSGTFTELKSLQDANNISAAMKRSITRGAHQLERHTTSTDRIVDGHVIIDGRAKNLTSDDALLACQRAVGQANAHGQELPKQVRFILGDATSRFFEPNTSIDEHGYTRFDKPGEDALRTTREPETEDEHERH